MAADPAFTGAYQRQVSLSQVAVGDGTTDDTTAVQAALDSGATEVIVDDDRSGATYLVGALTVPAGVTFRGQGGIIKAKTGLAVNTYVITVSAGSAVVGVKLNGNGAAQANGVLGIGATTVDGVTIRDCEVWNCSKDAIRTNGTVNDLVIVGNYVHDLTSTATGIAVLSTGSRYRVDGNVVEAPTSSAIAVHGDGGTDISGLSVSGNLVDSAGQIPIEVFDAASVTIADNVILAGTSGISTLRVTNFAITGNAIQDQTLYAVELNDDTDGLVADNATKDCASLVQVTAASDNVKITGNTYVGSGLASAVAGNSVIMVKAGDGIVITDNYIRGHEYITPVIRLGVGLNVTKSEVSGNTIIVDTANAGLNAINCSTGSDIAVRDNRVLITRDLVAGDANVRVINLTQGGVSGLSIARNEVTFLGAIAAATSVVGIGSIFAGASTAASSSMVDNRVISGPVAFRVDITSADFVLADNEGRSCTSEYGAINAAVIFRRTQREFEAAAAPTGGAWLRGDRVWNTAPAASGAPGWVCVTAGTPGTWKAMANLAT